MSSFAQRRERVQSILGAESLDAVLVSNPVNVSYLTNFSGDSSYLVLMRDRSLLVSDGRFTQQLSDECPGLELHIRPIAQNIMQATSEVLNKLAPRSVGFESSYMTVVERETFGELAKTIDWKASRDRLERFRMVKDASEVAEIRQAIQIAERAFQAFRAMIRPDDTEKVLADRMEEYVRRFGGHCTSFPSIIAAGERSALPHAPPTTQVVGEKEFLLADWGASGRFYKSDLTRILITRKNLAFSRPSGHPKFEQIYGVVLAAQEQALRQIRPGIKCHEVDATARRVISDAGFGDYFGHGLGHGIGLQIHEAPALRPSSDVVLLAGMVVTVEPGIYIPEWGGVRIEDDVLVTPDGCEVLTSVTKDFRLLGCFD
jgi:Xaa-Pro aminopeptidase